MLSAERDMPPRRLALPIFRSPAQAKILTQLYVTGGDRPQSLSAISKRTGVPLSTAQREVEQLERSGLVASERIGNTRLVYANERSPYFTDLQSLLLKAFGPTTLLSSLLRRIPGIDRAYIYGSWARRYKDDESVVPRDLDVLVIGEPNPNAVYAAARKAEADLNLEVNPLLVAAQEWEDPRGIVKRIKGGPLVELELGDGAETDDR
jgi:predicted nucleotidyltransferase